MIILYIFRDRSWSPSGKHFDFILNPKLRHFGPMLGHLGPMLGHFGPKLGHLGAKLGHLGGSWRHLGSMLKIALLFFRKMCENVTNSNKNELQEKPVLANEREARESQRVWQALG